MELLNITNSTKSPTSGTLSVNDVLMQNLGYIILGLAAFLFSFLVSISLLIKSVELRKDQRHILLTTMEIANSTYSFSYFLAGCYRLKYFLTGEYKFKVTPWDCMLRTYTGPFIFSFQFVIMSTFVTSLERMVAVYFPITYYVNVKTRHQMIGSIIVTIYCLLITVISYLCSYFTEQTSVPYNCVTQDAVGDAFARFHYSVPFFISVISALISLATVFELRKHKVGMTESNHKGAVPSSYSQKQKELSKSLILSTLVVFVWMCFPLAVRFITSLHLGGSSQFYDLMGPYNNFIVICHSIFSDVILCCTNQQVRDSLKNSGQSVVRVLKKLAL